MDPGGWGWVGVIVISGGYSHHAGQSNLVRKGSKGLKLCCMWGQLHVGSVACGVGCMWGRLHVGSAACGVSCMWGRCMWGQLHVGSVACGVSCTSHKHFITFCI